MVFCRICFCTADKCHGKVFGFIARNTENETMECYAYACSKRKIVSIFQVGITLHFIPLNFGGVCLCFALGTVW